MDSLKTFATTALAQIDQELSFHDNMEYSALTLCGQEKTVKLLSAVRRQTQDYAKELSELCSSAHKLMKETRHDPSCSFAWRMFYTDAALAWALLDCLDNHESNVAEGETYWKDAVARLDNTIVIAGAPGEGRLDLVLDSIEQIQNAYLPFRPQSLDTLISPLPKRNDNQDSELLPSASLPVPVLSGPPSISAFRATLSRTPFILRRFANDWPAVCERRWASKAHLQRVAGRGRVVPIEIGSDYRTDDWTQRMTDWDDFLDYLFLDAEFDCKPEALESGHKEVMYLAQHDLFKQFPALRRDVIIPDYVYMSLPAPEHYPQYHPPANDEELVLNTWLGPQATVSPAHTDPYYNFYTQVVGQKTVWLAPPSVSHALSPYSEPSGSENAPSPSSHPLHSSSNSNFDKKEATGSVLGNTSRLDVFASISDLEHEPGFVETVIPVAMSALLEEGDMLFFPPGWWHAMRSESTSFSVSMWF